LKERKKMTTKSDLTRQINNAKRRLKRLKKRRSDGPEAGEAFENAPLAQGAMQVVAHLDEEIKKEKDLIASLKKKR